MYYEIPYADEITEYIDLYFRTWDDLMRQRQRFNNRAIDPITGEVRAELAGTIAEDLIRPGENQVRRRLEKLIREHPMADWLAEARTQGARVATVLSMIRHPHRFPGQMCSEGHYLLPTFEAGGACPCAENAKKKQHQEEGEEPDPCPGIIQVPRSGTGCRALWHMAGMYPVRTEKQGVRLARRLAGTQASHSTRVKTAIMMKQGIGDQLLAQKSRYEETYREARARLEGDYPDRRPGYYHGTAKVIAVKAWLGDLLTEWKKRVPLEGVEGGLEIELRPGELSAVPA